jgi:flagellin
MTSILNNPSAITALQSLRATQNALSIAQKQVSTGFKIGGAEDNASTWSIAEAMKSDKAALTTISDALAESSSILNVANAAVKSAISVMNDIKSALVQAQQPGTDTTKILTSLQQLGSQLKSVVSSATFTGMNVLDGSETGSVKFVASYNNGGGGASTVGTIDLSVTDLTNTGGTGILEAAQATGAGAATDFTGLVSNDLAAGTIADTLSNADKAIADLTTYAAEIGATQSRVTSQNEFIKTMTEALTTGVSSLVDADMNEASTRLQALQTQQQLGVQALSIANQNAQMILKLFQ